MDLGRHVLSRALVRIHDLPRLGAMGAEATHQMTNRGRSRAHVRQTGEGEAILAALPPGMARQRRGVQR